MKTHTTKIKPEIISKCFPFFDNKLRTKIIEVGQWISLEPDDVFMKEDGYIKNIPIVLDGILKICRTNNNDKEILLYYLSTGQVCSMALTCCMGNIKSNITASAETNTELICIPSNYLEKWMSEFPQWKKFVMFSYQQRFNELIETIDSIAFRKMDERLIKFFIDLNKTTGTTIYLGKHKDIADALTSSREVISRLLKQLEKEEKVILSRNKIDFSPLM